MGPGRYICGCDRRITHANAYSGSDSNTYCYSHSYANSNCDAHSDSNGHSYCYSHGHSDGNSKPLSNRNSHIDAIDERYADSYSYWHRNTETYSYSKSSSVRSASSDTAA
jgi:hypothetical protein